MRYKLKHQTTYKYENSVENYQSIVCLQPQNLPFQICNNFKLQVEPKPAKTFKRTDFFGNTKHYFSLHEPHKLLKVTAISDIEVIQKLPQIITGITCKEVITRQIADQNLKIDLLDFQLPTSIVKWEKEVVEFVDGIFEPEKPFYECVKKLSSKIFTEFQFKSGSTTVNTPLKTLLKERKGVCQDFSHLAIACLRSKGFAAKYVSGYIETIPPKGKPKLQGSDASHAWFSAYVPDMGWCEFDPTNNLVPGESHIITAYGRDYADVAPMKGIIFSSGKHTVKVEVDVIRT
jgi:transglutaminase-like putative cysteine protease